MCGYHDLGHLVLADKLLFDLLDGHHLARLDVEPPEHSAERALAQRVTDLLLARRDRCTAIKTLRSEGHKENGFEREGGGGGMYVGVFDDGGVSAHVGRGRGSLPLPSVFAALHLLDSAHLTSASLLNRSRLIRLAVPMRGGGVRSLVPRIRNKKRDSTRQASYQVSHFSFSSASSS